MTPDNPIDLSLVAIGVMAAVSFLIRAGGFWLMGHVPITPRVRRVLDALPGSIVAAAVVPIAIKGGTIAMLAVAVAGAIMTWRGNALAAVAAGVATAVVARSVGW